MNQKETDKILIDLQKGIKKLIKDQQEMKKEQQEMQKEQKEIREELTRIGNTVTLIEYEHGRKIDLILDVLIGHTDKLEEHDKRFEKDERIIEMHGNQIYGIEQKIKAI